MYIEGATHELSGKKEAAKSAKTGSFAPHGTKGVSIIVSLRSDSFSMVLEAMMPGTEQPVPTSMGIKDFPERPNWRNILSIMKATLAMYPQSSSKDMKRNRIISCGTNPRTAPTPPMMPSVTSACSHSAAFPEISMADTLSEIPPKSSSVHPMVISPRVCIET